jgi:tRNA (adenine57-N1/adenine58-N1)-methyltransferase
VTCSHRDVVEGGFGIEENKDVLADAIFLDLPNPWSVIDTSVKCLKPGGRLCNFSPCIEQVQKAVAEMYKEGLTDIRTFEVLRFKQEIMRITAGDYQEYEEAKYGETK